MQLNVRQSIKCMLLYIKYQERGTQSDEKKNIATY